MCKRLLCLTCCILVLGLATGTLAADLLVQYKFDETSGTVAGDASGHGFDGTIVGTASWVEGYVGGALEFFGTENVTLPADVMGLTSTIGSVAFWMNADAPTRIYTIFWGGDNTTGGGFGPENEMHVHLEQAQTDIWSGGELSFWAMANPSTFLFSDPDKGTNPATPPVNPIIMTDNQWHHVAATWGDGTVKLFIDGLLNNQAEYVSTDYVLSHIFLGQMGGGGRRYAGKLDDVRIYSNALTDEEVYNIFENPGTDVNDRPVAIAQEFVLSQNYPNPFNSSTSISYQLMRYSDVRLDIFNQRGQLVRTLVQGQQATGSHSVQWDGLDYNGQPVSSGVYMYRLQAEHQMLTRKLMLMK
jgi:hypothetical protein